MSNMVMLVGRLVSEVEDNKVVLAVNRNYKNEEGLYDTDLVDVTVWNGIESNMKEYCHKGDLIGIKGKIETKEGKLVVIAEKVTFLSCKKQDDKE